MQNSLFDGDDVGEPPDPYQLARKTDPHTSLEAAASLRAVRITKTRQAILACLRRHPEGLTDEQLNGFLNYLASDSGLRTRRSELVEGGLVADSGKRLRSKSGRRMIVWIACPSS